MADRWNKNNKYPASGGINRLVGFSQGGNDPQRALFYEAYNEAQMNYPDYDINRIPHRDLLDTATCGTPPPINYSTSRLYIPPGN